MQRILNNNKLVIKAKIIQNYPMIIEPYSAEIEKQMQELYSRLPEKSRRLYAGVEALKLGYGGISYIAALFSCSRDTVSLGIKELGEEESLTQGRSRKKGGGRTPMLKKNGYKRGFSELIERTYRRRPDG